MSLIANIRHYEDLSAYTSTSGAVAWRPNAGLAGYPGGLEVTYGSSSNVTVDFDDTTEATFNVRLYWAKRTWTVPSGASVRFLEISRNDGAETVVWLDLNNNAGTYRLVLNVKDDNDGIETDIYNLPSTWEKYVEVLMAKASGASSNDGEVYVILDGIGRMSVLNLDLHADFTFDRVRVGQMATVSGTPSGFAHFDLLRIEDGMGVYEEIGEETFPYAATLRETLGRPTLYLPSSSGAVWACRAGNYGGLEVLTPAVAIAGSKLATDLTLPIAQRKLLDSSRASVWKIQVNDDEPTQPYLETVDQGTLNTAHYHELSVLSDNGREWALTVNSAGVLVMTALTSDWPVYYGSPKIATPDGRTAILTVTDAGNISVSTTPALPTERRGPKIRAKDDSAVYTIAVDNDLNVTTSSAGNTLPDQLYYEYEVESPGSTRWRIWCDGDGTLAAFNVSAFDASRAGNAVYINNQGELILADPRFKGIHSPKTNWGGRVYKGGRA